VPAEFESEGLAQGSLLRGDVQANGNFGQKYRGRAPARFSQRESSINHLLAAETEILRCLESKKLRERAQHFRFFGGERKNRGLAGGWPSPMRTALRQPVNRLTP